ncbi:sugar ABC transporter substrate-binding protein [Kineosporia babensis]|uniref:Sugar ABC transporter substrate-binding protein n=1 Tax=Kineosporia babensis TaxID=499548 RepID=A0A9X1T3M1_9ACTN|nr:sugar ABC transporter substrate-binding protein [Kineosporia babensis]MCD5315808.1 sugar ABC transporter substrate-binding protein [Kineosporia babensis]
MNLLNASANGARLPLAAATAAVLLTSACSSASPATAEGGTSEGKVTVAMNLYSRELPYFQQIVKGAQAAGDADGNLDLKVTYGEVDPQMQYSQLESALSTSPDALMVVPMDAASVVPVLQQASTSGVPVVTVANDLTEAGQQVQTAHVGANYEEVGRVKAQYLAETLGSKAKVGYIHAIRGNSFTEEQFVGAKEVFAENPGLEIIDGGYAGAFSSDAGLTTAENLLTAHPDLDAIYFDNDDLALGGITAIQQRGIDSDDIVVIGGDGTPDAIAAVEAGTLDMTVSLCGYVTGVRSTELMLDFLRNGTKPAERVLEIPTLQIDSDSVTEAKEKITAGEC